MTKFFAIICILVTYTLFAEIETVSLTWDNRQCLEGCTQLINKQLSKLKEVASVTTSQQNGIATMQWKTGVPFTFKPVNDAIKRVGIHVETLRIKLRGTIVQKNRKFYIISLGDETTFNLLGTASDDPSKNRYVIQTSRFNRPLSDEQKKMLTDAMKNKLTVTIEGPIYQPYQFPPLDLIIENISVSQPVNYE